MSRFRYRVAFAWAVLVLCTGLGGIIAADELTQLNPARVLLVLGVLQMLLGAGTLINWWHLRSSPMQVPSVSVLYSPMMMVIGAISIQWSFGDQFGTAVLVGLGIHMFLAAAVGVPVALRFHDRLFSPA